MSTTFDPTQKVAVPHLMAPPHSNGKASTPLSLAASRNGFWRKGASKELRKGRASAEEAWSLYWNERAARPDIAALCRADGAPLQWEVSDAALSQPTSQLLQRLGQGVSLKQLSKQSHAKEKHRLQGELSAWAAAAKGASAGFDLAVGCLAAAHLLGKAGGAIDALLSWKVLDFLAETAAHANGWKLTDASPETVVAQQLLAGELPLTLAYHFGEMAPLSDMAQAASERLAEGVDELLNGEGLLRGEHLAAMRPLLACWTRCRAIGQYLKPGRWDKKTQRQYQLFVRQALRWTDPDGRLALSDGTTRPWPAELLHAALHFAGSAKNGAAAAELLGKQLPGSDSGKAKTKLPASSDSCEWARLAVMRSGWRPTDAMVWINYASPALQLEAWADGRRLLSGAWSTETKINGQVLQPRGSWEELCWFSDKDGDYLELSLPLEGGARLERQIMLAHRDHFLLMADHLKSDEQAELEHAWQIPLGGGLLFCGEGETRDALLIDGTPRARLIPLALPEWRIDPRVGELSSIGGAVRLTERDSALRLACPLFIDLKVDRAGQASTWRQLTVAELLMIQNTDVAVSYRIQAGKDQWVYYRSQGPRGNRTFLGQNTSSEFLIARFLAPEGSIETLLEIEE